MHITICGEVKRCGVIMTTKIQSRVGSDHAAVIVVHPVDRCGHLLSYIEIDIDI